MLKLVSTPLPKRGETGLYPPPKKKSGSSSLEVFVFDTFPNQKISSFFSHGCKLKVLLYYKVNTATLSIIETF